MDTATLLISTAGKIVFVLVIVLTIAPVLVWAERRQSAMIQDRIGPVRAGIQLPAPLTKIMGNWPAAIVVALVAVVAAVIALASRDALMDWYLTSAEHAEVQAGAHTPWHFEALFFWGPILGAVGAVGGVGAALYIHKKNGNITLIGLLHPLADSIKFIWKEDFVPPNADKLLHAIAPILVVVTALVTFAVIPFADTLHPEHYRDFIGYAESGALCLWPAGSVEGATPVCTAVPAEQLGAAIPMQIASLNVGVLFIFAVAGTGVIGAAIAGYSSDNKYALLGGLRAASQMVSYEVTLGLTIVPCLMVYGSLLLEDAVRWQIDAHVWGIFIPVLTLAFILFFAASIAETKRIPFDLPESESELVAGYFTEYSGFKFGMFFTGEFIEVVVLSAVASAFFFGGYDFPFLTSSGLDLPGDTLVLMPHWAVIAIQMLTFVAKIIFFVWFQLMIRWTLPRFRYDQLMDVCWKLILPLSLLNIMLTGLAILLWPAS